MPETLTPFEKPQTVAGQMSRQSVDAGVVEVATTLIGQPRTAVARSGARGRGAQPYENASATQAEPISDAPETLTTNLTLPEVLGRVGDVLISSPYGPKVPDEMPLPINRDAIQRQARKVVAGGLVTTTLASGLAQATASAEPAGRVGSTTARAETVHKAQPRDRAVFLAPGGTIYEVAQPIAERRGIPTMEEVADIEIKSGVESEYQAEHLQPGSKLHIPAAGASEYIREPRGSNLSTTAAQNGLTLKQLLDMNRQYRTHPDLVQAGAILKVSGGGTSSTKPTASHNPHPKPQSAPIQPVIKPTLPKKTPEPTLPAPATHAARQKAATPKPVSRPDKSPTRPTDKPGPSHSGPNPTLNVMQHAVDHAFKATTAVSNESSHHLGQPMIHGLEATAKEVMQTLSHVDKRDKFSKLASRVGECASRGHMFGNTNEQIAMNYFILCQGDTAAQAAGIVGNIIQESSIQPEEIESGGFTKDPTVAGEKGWGIAQWTPASKALSESKKYDIKGPIYTLQTQLALVSAEMKDVSPTGQQNMLKYLKRIKDPADVAENFEQNFEEGPIAAEGGGQLASRQQYAREAARSYDEDTLRSLYHHRGVNQSPAPRQSTGPKEHKSADKPGLFRAFGHAWGQTSASVSSSLNNPIVRTWQHADQAAAIQGRGNHSHRSHDTAKAHSQHTVGNAAIYYAALRYDSASYEESMRGGHEGVSVWHKKFPTISPKALIDCSGLVNLALSAATGGQVNLSENTVTERSDRQYWKEVSRKMARRGDLFQPVINGVTGQHVEILDEDKGDEVDTFGAHSSNPPQSKQVGPTQYTYNSQDKFFRYVGPGAPLGNHVRPQASSNTGWGVPHNLKPKAHDKQTLRQQAGSW